jgi:hypothetical protein
MSESVFLRELVWLFSLLGIHALHVERADDKFLYRQINNHREACSAGKSGLGVFFFSKKDEIH